VPLPGASAVLAAIVASGVAGPRWAFEGFLPRSGRDRQDRLRRIADDDRGTVVFEAPARVAATLRDLAEVCAGDRPAAVCRELTKLHETIVRGTLAELAEAAKVGAIPPRGEFALVVGSWPNGRPISAKDEGEALEAARAAVERLVAAGTARGDAARQVASETGIARRQLYGADRARSAAGNPRTPNTGRPLRTPRSRPGPPTPRGEARRGHPRRPMPLRVGRPGH